MKQGATPPPPDADENSIVVREAREEDVAAIAAIFAATYGEDYPHHGFLQSDWLKRSIYNDDLLMLVAEDSFSGEVLGSASVIFDVGAHSDLVGEFGRLAVAPTARSRGVGRRLMAARVEYVSHRLHVGVVENRCVHPFSQQISTAHGFVPVGFLLMKHMFRHRESIAMYCRHFGDALAMRRNHPRIVPEAHALAHLALTSCGLPDDAIVDEESPAYPGGGTSVIEDLESEGLPALLRIERGRVRHREVFGPMRLGYGFFKLSAQHATYLVARDRPGGAVNGAIGYIRDDDEKAVRVFELISRDDHVIRVLLDELVRRAGAEWNTAHIEIDISAHAPRMQRTVIELGFVPEAFVPAMVFHEVERLDVVRFARLLVPLDLGEIRLTPRSQMVADLVLAGFTRQSVQPEIAAALDSIPLFAGLTSEQRERVAGLCDVRHLAAGESIFASGEPATSMLVLLGGEAHVHLGARSLGRVGAGEPLGEVAVLTCESHSADATAETEGTAAILSQSDLTSLSRQRPDICMVLYRNLAIALGRKLRRAAPEE